MNDKNIFDALRDIDPQWIVDAAPTERRNTGRVWIKWGALAACLCLVVAAVLGVMLWLRPNDSVSPEPGTDPGPTVTLPPHTHVFGEWLNTKDATCAEMGEQTRLCACGEKETKLIAVLPHFAGEWVIEREPTIKLPTPDDPDEREPGLKCQFCEHCGAKLDEEIIPATGSLGLAYAINPDGKTFSVAGIGNCTDEDIIVPENFCGYHVTSVIEGAFKSCKTIKSITLPETVTVIGAEAFWRCEKLATVTLPEGLAEIGAKVFYNCAIKTIDIPQSVTAIGESAFAGCYYLESIALPDGIMVLEARTFENCHNLQNITFPENLRIIGDSAFSSCIGIKELVIPATVTNIGKNAFYNCHRLERIVLPEGLDAIEGGMFNGCSVLESITIPQSVTRIEVHAFWGCRKLVSIEIPENVTVIGSHAFHSCGNLERVVLPEGLEHIEMGAFSGCEKLRELNLPPSLKSIGINAFAGCDQIMEVENYVTYIGNWAIEFDTTVRRVVVREGTVGLAADSFSPFTSGTPTHVTLPNSIKYIGDSAFSHKSELEQIIFEGTKEEWEAIEKAENWDQYSYNYTVIFTGDIEE